MTVGCLLLLPSEQPYVAHDEDYEADKYEDPDMRDSMTGHCRVQHNRGDAL